MGITMNPKHRHDCDQCIYLGSMFNGAEFLDWYRCGKGIMQSVIARRSDEGSDYWSMPVSMLLHKDRPVIASTIDRKFSGYCSMTLLAKSMLDLGSKEMYEINSY